MSFMIETSARHIHLTQETLEKLFGEGYELTVRKPLSYPGQFASNERLTGGPQEGDGQRQFCRQPGRNVCRQIS